MFYFVQLITPYIKPSFKVLVAKKLRVPKPYYLRTLATMYSMCYDRAQERHFQ